LIRSFAFRANTFDVAIGEKQLLLWIEELLDAALFNVTIGFKGSID
jgi:hypothetical protein